MFECWKFFPGLALGLLIVVVPLRLSRADGPELVSIKPGTVVAECAPTGWSHLVIKSIPTLGSGDLATLPSSAGRTAALFRTVFLANVKRDAPNDEFRLERIGRGLCIPFQGHDEVVDATASTPALKSLGTLDRIVLGQACGELARGELVAKSAGFAIYKAPVSLLVAGKLQTVLLCYIFQLDRKTGELATYVWWTPDAPNAKLTGKSLIALRSPTVFECKLHVEAARILGAVPVSWTFGMAKLPPGDSKEIAPDVVRILQAAALGKVSARATAQTFKLAESEKAEPAASIIPQVPK